MKFGLTEKENHLLQQLLINPFKDLKAQIWIFGSRARGDHKKYSDIDVLYELPDDQSLPSGFLSQIVESLEESDLPYKIDIVNRQEVAPSYREQIEKEKIQL